MKKIFAFIIFLSLAHIVLAGTETTNYSLYKPALDERGWGTKVNANFDVIDRTMDTLSRDIGKDFLLFEPDNINTLMPVCRIDSSLYPAGVTLVSLSITLEADAAYSLEFEEWAGDPPAVQNTLTTVTTTGTDSFKKVLAADMSDSVLDADDYIFIDIPATDVPWVHGKIIFTIANE